MKEESERSGTKRGGAVAAVPVFDEALRPSAQAAASGVVR
jgi:hypothetical protein